VARAVGRDPVEEQVVDGVGEDNGFEMRAGELGQRVELVDGFAVARTDEPCRELVEGTSARAGRTGTNSAASARASSHGVEHPRLAWTAKGTTY
jgi:hypothetical protein